MTSTAAGNDGQFDPFEDQTYYNNESLRAIQLIAELDRNQETLGKEKLELQDKIMKKKGASVSPWRMPERMSKCSVSPPGVKIVDLVFNAFLKSTKMRAAVLLQCVISSIIA